MSYAFLLVNTSVWAFHASWCCKLNLLGYLMEKLTVQEGERISPVWDLSQERVFTMTILNQRVSFFGVLFCSYWRIA